jgi:hypothetical protein
VQRTSTPNNTQGLILHDTDWGRKVFSYEDKSPQAFLQFCYRNAVPMVRVGKRKLRFNEQAVMDWIAKRSTA